MIDFTAPEAVVQNMRAVLATGARMVVGTTGWYDKLADMRGLAERKQAGLLYGTNFSVGVQVMLQLAKKMGELLKNCGLRLLDRRDAPCDEGRFAVRNCADAGQVVKAATGVTNVPIKAHREGDAAGLHVLEAKGNSRQACADA